MKYFKSLNCCLCYLPFVPIANQPRSPRKLRCGWAMCHECLEKEKALKQEERKHQCIYSDCFYNDLPINFAFYLMDVLSRDFIALMPTKSGYVLSKPHARIECPICHRGYSLTKSRQAPFDLVCNHTICEECFLSYSGGFSLVPKNYEMICPTCQVKTVTNLLTTNNSLKEFLRELPEMIKQYEQGNMSIQKCSGCITLYHIETMFNCWDCSAKICGACAFRHHHEHKVEDWVSFEVRLVNHISNEVKDVATIKIGVYEKIFSELHNENKKIIDHLKRKLINEADQIKKLVRIQEVLKEQQEIEKLGDKFEAISEEYMPQIRGFNSKLQDLLRQLEK